MKNTLTKLILLTVALGALIALIAVMLKNKDAVKAKGKAVAGKLRAKRKSAEEPIEPECDWCCDEVDCDCGYDVDCEAEAEPEPAEADETPLADEVGCECGDAE